MFVIGGDAPSAEFTSESNARDRGGGRDAATTKAAR